MKFWEKLLLKFSRKNPTETPLKATLLANVLFPSQEFLKPQQQPALVPEPICPRRKLYGKDTER